jgi:hypothetical protein
MQPFRNPDLKVRDILRSLHCHGTLVSVLHEMVSEIQRLEEENRQMRAAVSVYRDVLRKTAQKRARKSSA